MSIKNTIARIIRSDFKQMQGNRYIEETDTLLCHNLSEQFLKADLPLGDQTKVFQRACPQAVSSQAVPMGKKAKPRGLWGSPELTAVHGRCRLSEGAHVSGLW